MQQSPQEKNTRRSPARYALAAVIGIALAAFTGYFGTLDIGRVSVHIRKSFPAVVTNIDLPLPPPNKSVMTKINHTVFSSDWIFTKQDDCKVRMLAVISRVCDDVRKAQLLRQDNVRLPFFNRSTKASFFFTVTADINHMALSSGWLRITPSGWHRKTQSSKRFIAPDECITSIQVNGIDVTAVRQVNQSLRCIKLPYNIDLSPYLQSGLNEVKINIFAISKGYGINLASFYSYPILAMMGTGAGISLIVLCVYLIVLYRRLSHPDLMVINRYMAIGSISLSGVLMLFILQAIVEGHWTWVSYGALGSHLPQLSVEFLPIPFVFFLWLRVIECNRLIPLRFSPLACALSIAAFTIAQEVVKFPTLCQYVFATAIFSGLFVLVSFRECLRRATHNPLPTFVAIVAGSAACSYYWLSNIIWKKICGWTTYAVYATLHLFGAQAHVSRGAWPSNSFEIISPYFYIQVFSGCSGIEGIVLFIFMLSIVFLYDWELYRSRRILLLYVVGVIYMFFINVLRITAFFMFGYWAFNPNAWEWVQSLKGAPLDLFHTYVGWVFYLIAFVLFI
jgi:exosortase/archaeosortase family protein